jgi:prepilin peptidase CpaA
VQTAVLIVGIGLLALIAYGDVRTRRIPNELSVAIAILGLIRIILLNDAVTAGHSLLAGAVIFGTAFFFFWRGAIGGGDVKLVTATALLISYHDMFSFLFLMSLCGGMLALTMLAQDKLCPRLPRLLHQARITTESETAPPVRSTVPYGVAIAAAGIITLVLETSVAR